MARQAFNGKNLIRTGGIAVAAVACLFLLYVAYTALQRISDLRDAGRWVTNSLRVREGAGQLMFQLQDAESAERGFIITGDPSYLGPFTDAERTIPRSIADLRFLIGDDPARQATLLKIDALTQSVMSRLRETIAARRESGFAAAVTLLEGNRLAALMDEVQAQVTALRGQEDRLLAERRGESNQKARAGFAATIVGLATAVLLIAAAGATLLWVIARRERDLVARGAAEAGSRAIAESEERLRVTVMSIGDAVAVTDAQGTVTRLNPVAETLTGWTERDAAGKPLVEVLVLVNEQTRRPAENPVDKVIREGSVVGLANHTLLVSRGGREIPIDDSAAPIRGVDGGIVGVVMVFRDISERRRRERDEAARVDSEHARVLASAEALARMGSWRLDLSSGAVVSSPQMRRLYGIPPEVQLTTETFFALVHPDERENVRKVVTDALERRSSFRYRGRLIRPDGTTWTVDAGGDVELDGDGKPRFLFGFSRDVTDEVRAEEALREQTELYEKLLGAQSDVGDGVAITEGSRLVFANEALGRMYGYNAEELQALPSFLDLVVPDDRDRVAGILRRRARGEGSDSVGETRVVRRDGTSIVVEYAAKAVQSRGRNLLISIVRDVTERRRADASVRQLSQRLLKVQDEEQERIARELKSTVGKTLEEVLARLAAVRESGTVFDWKTSEALREGLRLAQEAANGVRTLSRLLYPPMLDEEGLSEAIRWYSYDYTQSTRVRLVLDVPPRFPRLGRDAERALFRVVQESLANVARHSGSATAAVLLREEPDGGVLLEIRDSGKGIPPQILEATRGTVAIAGVGIRGMVERMRELGGTLEIAADGFGTAVIAKLPPG